MAFLSIRKAITRLFKQNSFIEDDLSSDEKNLFKEIAQINANDELISNDLYLQLRTFEVNWLERHYDFNTIEGIDSIPVTKDLPGAPSPTAAMKGCTGEVYYYLRRKAYSYEEEGNMSLALACMQKSVALVKCKVYCTAEDCYPLVKMLARYGFVEEAYSEKEAIDRMFSLEDVSDNMIKMEVKRGCEARDFLWIQENIPDKCPKSISGYRRMKTQNTKNYQALQKLAADLGRKI